MTTKIWGRTEATPKTNYACNSSRTASRIKAAVVRFALWGLIPTGFAEWLIQLGGLKDA